MQADADAIICRPTAGDRLEQMKGRVDRPGQTTKRLILVVIYAANTVEEAEFANIQLAGNFFRQYIAPIARRYREYKDAVDLEAIRAAGGDKRLKKGAVQEAWHKCLEITSGNLAAAPADGDDSVGGGGVDGAALSAVMCVDAMKGTDLESTIMPAYHRGIPDLEASAG